MHATRELILGGQKSGKSRRGEMLAADWLAQAPTRRAVLLATARAHDQEMRERIARHRADRAARVPQMDTVEEPLHLADALRAQGNQKTLMGVDCLTLWLTNLLMPEMQAPAEAQNPPAANDEVDALLAALGEARGPVVLIGNEIGLGVIPLGREVRAFVDALGLLSQRVAAACERHFDGGGPAARAEGRGAMSWRTICLAALCWMTSAAGAVSLADDRGVEVKLAQPPQRIVSLLPSLTESVCALKACERLVGVDDYSNWPAAVHRLPHVGGLEDANVERIVVLKPDLVLLAKSARVIERLEALGIPVLALEPKSMKDVERVLGKLGKALDHEAEARALWQQLDAGVDRAVAALPRELRGKRVYFEVNNGPYAASEASFIGQTLARLGVSNIVPAALGPFPKLNPEFVVRANPQLIMIGDRNAVAMAERPGWDAIDAVRARRVCIFTAAEGDVLVRPGPRMAEAAEIMVNCLKEKFR